jgi:hypothetical protein
LCSISASARRSDLRPGLPRIGFAAGQAAVGTMPIDRLVFSQKLSSEFAGWRGIFPSYPVFLGRGGARFARMNNEE